MTYRVLHVPAASETPVTLLHLEESGQGLSAAIGAEHIEWVSITPTLVLVVDEVGVLQNKPRNGRLSRSFYPGLIAGDALIISEGMTGEGPDFISLTDEDLALSCFVLHIDIPKEGE